MKTAIFLIALATSCAAEANDFCVVTAGGTQCGFTDANFCKQHARAVGGMCVVDQQSRPTLLMPDIAGSFERGMERGLRMRQLKEAAKPPPTVTQVQPAAPVEETESPPSPELMAAAKAWKQCTTEAATRYASQPGEVGSIADAALGACSAQFAQLNRIAERDDAETARRRGASSALLQQVKARDEQAAIDVRNDWRTRLMSLILEARIAASK